jgi:parallel beta-helix repeat protein
MKNNTVITFTLIFGLLSIVNFKILFAKTLYVGIGEAYTSIDSAVDAANDGDTVIVKNGIYHEQVSINNEITLKSEHGYTHTTIVSSGRDYPAMLLYSDNLIVDGFTLYGSKNTYAITTLTTHYCIIRNNRFGVDEERYNKYGIELDSLYRSLITNNIFQKNTDSGILIEYGSNTICNNSFIGGNYAIELIQGNGNTIFLNSFINQTKAPIASKKNLSNNYYSPFEIAYAWKGSHYKSHLGNFYSDISSVIDTNNNGILDGFYSMPYNELDDKYPLRSQKADYTIDTYFLQNNLRFGKIMDNSLPGRIYLKSKSSILFISHYPLEKAMTFSGDDHWSGTIQLYSDYPDEEIIQVEIGYSTTGSDFVAILSTSIQNEKHNFIMEKKAFSIQSNNYLAFRLTNLSERSNYVYTGLGLSYITPPLSKPLSPVVFEVSPDKGTNNGGTIISIQGSNFGDQQGNVFFDDEPAAAIESWSETKIVCQSPSHDTGFSNIQTINRNQLSGIAHYQYYFLNDSLEVGIKNHFQSIQQAIKYAKDGDTITVHPGIYYENIDVNKTLHLKSQSGALSTTIIGNENIVYVSADNATIQGFTIYGSDHSSTAVYLAAKNCRVIDNYIGINSEKRNEIGIDTASSAYIVNNSFSMNTIGIDLDTNFCTVAGNTFISNINGINAKANSNIIFYNNFIRNEKHTVSSKGIQNLWQSRIPVYYTYNGQAFISYIGNYYDNHYLLDTDMNGITNNHYLHPWTEPEDAFPLVHQTQNYDFLLLSLSSNFLIDLFGQVLTDNSAELASNGFQKWTIQINDALKQILSHQSVLYGTFALTDVPQIDTKFRLIIGQTTDGHNLSPNGIVDLVADGQNRIFSYEMSVSAMSFESNEQVEFLIRNYSTKEFNIDIRTLSSCFSVFPDSLTPAALKIYPNEGPTEGGSEVTLSGFNFGNTRGDSQVLFGNKPVQSYKSWSNTSIRCQVPAHEAGWVNIFIKRNGIILPFHMVKYLFKDKTIYVGNSQMFSGIQQAINHAQPFDTIIVKNGTYQENLYVNKPVMIQSESGYLSTTIVAEYPNTHAIEVHHENFTIDGFSIYGATDSDMAAIKIYSDFCTIKNNQCGIDNHKNNNYGIYINSRNNTIENNRLSYNQEDGIYADYSDNFISNNKCFKNNYGIQINYYSTVHSNICYENNFSGIRINDCYNIVLHNECYNNQNGISMEDGYNGIHSNKCFNNSNSGIRIAAFSDQNILTENICISNQKYGIYLNDSYNTVYLNQFQLNGTNVYSSYETNNWFSPIPIHYTYKETGYLKKLGNYYEDHIYWDSENDGILDEKVTIAVDDSEGDIYPLSSTIDNFKFGILFFQSNGNITSNDYSTTEIVSINPNENIFFQTDENAISETNFTKPQKLTGQIFLNPPLDVNDQLYISPGYFNSDHSFVSIANPVILTRNNYPRLLNFDITTIGIPTGMNGTLVIKIENPNTSKTNMFTGARWSFISIASLSEYISEPENDTLTITRSPNRDITNTNMMITIDGNSNEVIEYQFNGYNWQIYSQPIEITSEGEYEITAKFKHGNDDWFFSQPVSFVIDRTPPEKPTLKQTTPLTNIATSIRSIEVFWQASQDDLSDVIGYSYLLDNITDSLPDNEVETQELSFTSAVLEMEKSYYFHISAIDSVYNVSKPLHVGPFIIDDTDTSPPSPTRLVVANQTDSSITLKWDYISDYEGIKYHVFRSEMSDGLFYKIDTGGHNFHSINNQKVYFTDKGLSNDQRYYYKIKSIWKNIESHTFSNMISSVPEKQYDFFCNPIDLDSHDIGRMSRLVEIGGGVKYYFRIDPSVKFKGVMEVSCNKLPDHVSYFFSSKEVNYSTSMHDITLPFSFALHLSVGSAAIPGEYQFKLLLQNVWDIASSDFMVIPLMLTIKERQFPGILIDISKQPEPSLFEKRKHSSSHENESLLKVCKQISEPVIYHISKNEPVDIYGEVLPPTDKKNITLQLKNKDGVIFSSTTQTNDLGAFREGDWLSSFGMDEYILTAIWTDDMSNRHVSTPRKIIIEKSKPILTCNSRSGLSPKIDQSFTITGSIQPLKPGAYVYLKAINPDGQNVETIDCILDDNGQYEITKKFFDSRGIWKFKTYWLGDNTSIGCESNFLIVPVETSAGRGIILAGGEGKLNNLHFNLVKNITADVYLKFQARGFRKDMIHYAINLKNIDIDKDNHFDDVIDDPKPSKDSFKAAIETQFISELNENIPLFIYMCGHGTDDGRFIVLGRDEYITASELNQSLNFIQKDTGCVVILIIDSCYSGSFIKTISANNRIIITSTDNTPYQIDSDAQLTFSTYLFKKLLVNYSLKDAFDSARKEIKKVNKSSPLLDDNGDGIADEKDGLFSANQFLKGDITMGVSVEIDQNRILMPYLVSDARPVQISTRVLRGDQPTEAVWALIIPPESDVIESNELVTFRKENLSFNPQTQQYEGQLRCLLHAGLYKIAFMASQTNQVISDPVIEYVTVEKNTLPQDINCDGDINIADLILGLQALAGLGLSDEFVLCGIEENLFGINDIIRIFMSLGNLEKISYK